MDGSLNGTARSCNTHQFCSMDDIISDVYASSETEVLNLLVLSNLKVAGLNGALQIIIYPFWT